MLIADNGGKELGRQPHGERQDEEERIHDRPVKEDIHGKDGDHQPKSHFHQKIAKPPNPLLELRFGRPEPEPLGHLAEFRPLSGCDHHGLCRAAVDMRAHEEGVRPGAQGCVGGKKAGLFFHREGLARQSCFIDKKVLRFENQAVARDEIARVEDEDVPGNQFVDRNLRRPAVPKNRRPDADHRDQPVNRVHCGPLLPETEAAAGQNDGQDEQGIDRIVKKERQDRRGDQDEDDRTLELGKEERQVIRVFPGGQPVGTESGQAPLCFARRKPPVSRVQVAQYFVAGAAPEAQGSIIHVHHLLARTHPLAGGLLCERLG